MELALQLHREGRLAEAEAAYRAVLANDPDNVDALHFLGVLAFQRNDYRKAEELIGRSLARNPANAAARNNLGNALAAQARLDEAMACYREALALQPGFVGALVNLGAGSMAQGKAEEAVGYYAQALDIEPGNAMALSNLGNAYRQQDRLEDAAACHAKAIALDPDLPEAQHNFGNSLHDLGRLDEAEACYRKALLLRPGFAEALTSLGNVLDNRGRIEEAQQCHRQALAQKPDFADAHCNLGNTLVAQGQLQEAQGCFDQALRFRPGLAPATFSLANLRLMLGDYASGLPLYECRFDQQALSRLYAGMRARLAQFDTVPRWRGEDVAGKTLLVWTEQGLGDSLMLLRYLPLLKQRGVGRLLVYCEAALERLVREITGVDGVILKSDAPPLAGLHLHCPIMSLPLAFDTRLATIPAQVPYIRVTEGLGRAWAGKLSGAGRPQGRAGVVGRRAVPEKRTAQRAIGSAWADPGGRRREFRQPAKRGTGAAAAGFRSPHPGLDGRVQRPDGHRGAHTPAGPRHLRGYVRGASRGRTGRARLDAEPVRKRMALADAGRGFALVPDDADLPAVAARGLGRSDRARSGRIAPEDRAGPRPWLTSLSFPA